MALSLMEREAVRLPMPVGLKLTVIWQLAPLATGDVQELVWVKSPTFAPLIEIPETVSGELPILVS